MGTDRDPTWVKWMAAGLFCLVVFGAFIVPVVVAMITLKTDGNMFAQSDTATMLRGWEAFFFGLKQTIGGLLILAVPA